MKHPLPIVLSQAFLLYCGMSLQPAPGQQSLRLPGSAFVPLNSTTDYEDATGGCRYRLGGPEGFALDAQIPAGSDLATLVVYYEDRDVENLGLSLAVGDGQGNELVLAETASSGSAGFGTSQADLGSFETDPDIYLLLRATLPADTDQLKFCGAEIRYQPPAVMAATATRILPGSAFVIERNAGSWVDDGNGCSRLTSSVPPFGSWGLDVPPGSLIENLEFLYFDQNTSVLGEILLRLLEQDATGPSLQTVAAVTSDTNTGFGSSGTPISHGTTTRPLYLDWAQAISPSTLRTCGAIVTYAPSPDSGVSQNSAGAAFVAASSRTRYSLTSGCINHRGAGTPGRFVRHLHPPAGAAISALTVDFQDNDPGNNLSVALMAFDGLGGKNTLATFTSDDEGLAGLDVPLGAPYPTNERQESYALVADIADGQSSSNLLLCSAGVDYAAPDGVFEDGFETLP